MIPDAFRTDNKACDNPDHPSPSDLADDNPLRPPLAGKERDEANARWVALGFPAYKDCFRCGGRCDICSERMCSEYGPEPAITCAAHIECRHCHTDNKCADCRHERGAA